MGAMTQYFLQLKDIYSKEQNDEKCWAEEWGNKEQTKEKNYAIGIPQNCNNSIIHCRQIPLH